jgi:predicted phage tail protein
MSTRILAALLFSPLLLGCGDEGKISYKEKMPPAIPSGLSAEAGPNSKQITLNWNAVSNATSYTVFWNTEPTQSKYNNAVTSDNMTANITTNSFVHDNLTAGQEYFYRVAAFNQAGSKGLSTEASATPSP